MQIQLYSGYKNFNLKLIIFGIFSTQLIFAYPGFGKKINPNVTESCSQCHVAFPKLRLYGRTIREIGYNVPVIESEDEGLVKSIYRAIPIGFRGKIDLADTDNGKSMLSLVQILSSGTILNNKFAWWYHKHLYDVEEDKDSKLFDPNKFVPFNEGQPHEIWLQYNNSTAVNFRVGMFELPFWLSPIKTKVGESEFLCHGASGNPDMAGTLSSPQFGIALNGYLGKRASEDDWGEESDDNYAEGYNYAFAATNGKAEFPNGFDFLSDTDGSNMTFNTFFGRITKKNSLYAVGVWTLTGKSEVPRGDHDMDTMEMSGNMVDSKRYYRIGTDIDVFLKGDDINLYGDLVYGDDINRDFVGWLIGYDHLIVPKLFGLVRWTGVSFLNGNAPMDMNNTQDGDEHEEDEHPDENAHAHGAMIMDDASSISTGIFYLLYANLRIGFEYEYQLNGDIGKEIVGKGGKGIFQIQFGF